MTQSVNVKEKQAFLPEDTDSAVIIMTQITRQMLEFVLEEGKLLKKKDATTLFQIQKGKELRAAGYTNAANEFKNRIAEFKGFDNAMIGKLEALTTELGKATRENHKLLASLAPRKAAGENMVNNLFLLQGEDIAGTAE